MSSDTQLNCTEAEKGNLTLGMKIRQRNAVTVTRSPPEYIDSEILIVFHGRIKMTTPVITHVMVEM